MPKYDMVWRAKHAKCPYERITLKEEFVYKWVFCDIIFLDHIPKDKTNESVRDERHEWYYKIYRPEMIRQDALRYEQIEAENARLYWANSLTDYERDTW